MKNGMINKNPWLLNCSKYTANKLFDFLEGDDIAFKDISRMIFELCIYDKIVYDLLVIHLSVKEIYKYMCCGNEDISFNESLYVSAYSKLVDRFRSVTLSKYLRALSRVKG